MAKRYSVKSRQDFVRLRNEDEESEWIRHLFLLDERRIQGEESSSSAESSPAYPQRSRAQTRRRFGERDDDGDKSVRSVDIYRAFRQRLRERNTVGGFRRRLRRFWKRGRSASDERKPSDVSTVSQPAKHDFEACEGASAPLPQPPPRRRYRRRTSMVKKLVSLPQPPDNEIVMLLSKLSLPRAGDFYSLAGKRFMSLPKIFLNASVSLKTFFCRPLRSLVGQSCVPIAILKSQDGTNFDKLDRKCKEDVFKDALDKRRQLVMVDSKPHLIFPDKTAMFTYEFSINGIVF